MSLVREALDKAEREAAARNAREKGLPPTLAASAQPYRARRGGSGWRALAGAGVVVLLAVSALWWSQRRGLEQQPAAPTPTAPATAATAPIQELPTQEEARQAPSGEPASQPSASTGSSLPAPADAQASAGPGTPTPSPSPEDHASTVPTTPLAPATRPAHPIPGRTEPPPSKPTAPRASEQVLRDLDLGNGASLHLGGIAWSAVAPLAYLDGRLMGVGESVAGYRIEKIERQRVLLVSGERRVWLALHDD